MVQQPAQQLQDGDFKQAVGQQPMAAANLLGLGKQQVKDHLQSRHARQLQCDDRRKRPCQRVVQPSFKGQARAGKVRAFGWGIVEQVSKWARVQQDCRFIKAKRCRRVLRARVAYRELPAPQDMQVAMPFARIEMAEATQGAGVMQLCLDAEAAEYAG